ncbi:DNA topoisomerase VI subunit B [Candidatus Woesearchaeota archaeon]|nr:DNA topoisomerase VI subunit B [Candidatus Woesearchaeota archaeon]
MTEKIKAIELAKKQREISISEFFTKNRHLLGFDNPRKALLTTVKEAVDNSLDACEEMNVLPEVIVKIEQTSEERFRISVEDNGPGIVKQQIPNIFAKLLYGSKFHSLKQSRGQQGIGISASVMYSQLTTGKPTRIISKISPKKPANYYELHIDTKKNEPEIVIDKEMDWNKDHGTKIELELEGIYQKGKQGVEEYLKQTAIINPHLHLIYHSPENTKIEYPRAVDNLPVEPKEIKPHPYGVELGMLINMMKESKSRNISSFLSTDFSRVSPNLAKELCNKAGISDKTHPSKVSREEADKLLKVIRETKIISPPTNCLSPIGEELMLKGLKKEINADFYAAVTRPPSVYRGNPFLVEAAIAYGGDLPKEDLVRVLRFANRVPLLYQQSACASTRSIIQTSWNNYGLSQSKGALPSGPVLILVHVASVWVPFTSESKEAIAHYPEIIKEMKLALQECGRKVSSYIRKTVKAREQKEKISLFEKYIPELAAALSDLSDEKKSVIEEDLKKILKKGMKNLLAEIAETKEEK